MIGPLLAGWMIGCGGGDAPVSAPPGDWANAAPATVVEVVPCGDHTAIVVKEAVWTFTALVPAYDIAPGDLVLLGKGPVIHDKQCGDRVFPDVVVIDAARKATEAETQATIRVPPPTGGLSIADLYAKRTALAGQDVAVAGRIWKKAKYGGTNWYHVKDGTGAAGTDDFTFTTHAPFAVGDVVEVRGKLTIDKDLGFGYFYAVIVEDANVMNR